MPQTALGGFAALPVILTTILGGWLSGLIALIITLASHGVALSDKFAIGLVFLILLPAKYGVKAHHHRLGYCICYSCLPVRFNAPA
ncbi:hypothetical protein GTU79_10160 [Sodalis ligni]|uniref:hypothetical protein n=1 Tax=Sodalis ligni TaxID=2697027 RepID=UPI001BDE37CB|nr:hypothetical protein [Sodalis ligni]QWA12994.1 hypothetical protein GTU79_10160 [Sodalis ligni]